MGLNLSMHCGGQRVDLQKVLEVDTPPSTETHFPVPHAEFIDRVEGLASELDYTVRGVEHALSHAGMRWFGIWELENKHPEFNTVLGARNSHDKRFSGGCALGKGVFVCDNLSFTGEYKFSRKHTKNVAEGLETGFQRVFTELPAWEEREARFHAALKGKKINEMRARFIMVDALKEGIIPQSSLLKIHNEWIKPSYPEFMEDGYSCYRLFNAFTGNMKGGNLNTKLEKTVRLNTLFRRVVKLQS